MFGWVDFSEEERQRAFEIMELARIPGAIDELGLGILRDGFSNKLFPGTSTLHTHARYYFLTTYLMKYLEEEYSGCPLETIQGKLTEGEKDTALALIAWADNHGKPQTGITGSGFADTNRWVKQTPTYMNWAAAQTYGLIKDPGLKLNSFLRVVAHSKPKATPEDEEFSDSFTSGFWNVPLECYFQWKTALQKGEEISLELSPEESSQLKNVICQQWPRSLYAALLESPERLPELSEAASLSDGGKSFVQLASILQDSNMLIRSYDDVLVDEASNLSSLAALLHIRFNYVLARKAADNAAVEEREAQWIAHAETEGLYRERAYRCDLNQCFNLTETSSSVPRNRTTCEFLSKALEYLKRNDLSSLDGLIERREVSLKGPARSKIADAASYVRDSKGNLVSYGGTELTYRLADALNLAAEITAPMIRRSEC